jgi:hypothetical protein
MRRALAVLLAAAFACAPALAKAPFEPVDTAATQPDFFTFRARLQAAVARHDVAAVLAVVASGATVSFGGGDGGPAEFREYWRLDSPDSGLWDELATVLALGGDFGEDGAFEAPYVSSEWPDGIDGFEHVAIVGSGVRVRAAAGADAETIATLGFEIVAAGSDDAPDDAWRAVVLADGRAGFVDARYVRSPIDYRARFAKVGGAWKLVSFVAGD